MRKKIYYKDKNGVLYSEREAKGISGLKKVCRSIDEINKSQYDGIYVDIPFSDNYQFIDEISSKQIRNRKISKQMIKLGLL